MGNRIYGCDDCLAACPWNKFAVAARDMRLTARPELTAPSLAELARLTDRQVYAHGAVLSVNAIYRDAGVSMLEAIPVPEQADPGDFRGALIIAPPAAGRPARRHVPPGAALSGAAGADPPFALYFQVEP